MRTIRLISLIAVVLVASPVLGDTEFPYTATIATEIAEVRGGPSADFYATSRLRRGDTVEVYRHADEDWCAIRPPRDSYSWVSSRYVERSPDGASGRVLEADAPSRVGSADGRERHVVQVRLKQDERVDILGEENNGGQTWYHIAPPAGEFRWIERAALAESSAPRDANDNSSAPGDARAESARAPITPPGGKPVEADPYEQRHAHAGEWTAARTPIPDRPADADDRRGSAIASESSAAPHRNPSHAANRGRSTRPNATPAPRREPQSDVTGEAAKSNGRWRNAGSGAWRDPSVGEEDRFGSSTRDGHVTPNAQRPKIDDPPGGAPARDLQNAAPSEAPQASAFIDERDAIDFSLSRMVANPPDTWRLETLRERAMDLLANARTPAARADAQMLLAKIARFEELQYRHAAIAAAGRAPLARQADAPQESNALSPARVRPSFSRNPGTITPLSPNQVASNPANASVDDGTAHLSQPFGDAVRIPNDGPLSPNAESAFDASGVLKRVGSRRADAPRFALVDARGDIVSFITPRTGVNLQPFVGRQIGVVGTRGFMPEYRRAHVTATRVTALDATRLR